MITELATIAVISSVICSGVIIVTLSALKKETKAVGSTTRKSKRAPRR